MDIRYAMFAGFANPIVPIRLPIMVAILNWLKETQIAEKYITNQSNHFLFKKIPPSFYPQFIIV